MALFVALTVSGLGSVGAGYGTALADPAGPSAATGPSTATTTIQPGSSTTVAGPLPTTARVPTTTHAIAPTTAVPAPTTTSTTFAPGLLAISQAVKRTPPRNTTALIVALRPLEQLGFTTQQAAIAGFGQFPVAGPAYYTDDWLELRPGPVPALHPGIDIVAASGTPLRAPVDGVLTYDTSDPTGYGLDAMVTTPDHTFYRMAHMSATVKGLATGSAVTVGQVIGFVGSTGNSTGPHCHFEVHPRGGGGVEPKGYLDAWLTAAVAAAPQLIKSVEAARATPVTVAEAVPAAPVVAAAPNSAVGSESGIGGLQMRTQVAGAVRSNPLTVAALLAILTVLALWLPSARRRLQEREGRPVAAAEPPGAEPAPEMVPVVRRPVPAASDAATDERLRRWRRILLDPPRDAGGAVAT